MTFTDLPVTVLHRFDTGKSYESIDIYRDGGVEPLCREWDHVKGPWSAGNGGRVPGKEDVESFYSALQDDGWLPYPVDNLTHWGPKTKCSDDPDKDCGYSVRTEYYRDHVGAFVRAGNANITLGVDGSATAASHFDKLWPEEEYKRALGFNRTQTSSTTKVSIDPEYDFAPLCIRPWGVRR